MSNNSVHVDNTEVEIKLDKIVTCLENLKIQSNNIGEMQSGNKLSTYMSMVIAFLLAVSIGVQVLMVNKITALEQTQSSVNNIMLKGEKAGK